MLKSVHIKIEKKTKMFLLVTLPCISGVDFEWTDHNQSSFQCSPETSTAAFGVRVSEKVLIASVSSTLSFIFYRYIHGEGI